MVTSRELLDVDDPPSSVVMGHRQEDRAGMAKHQADVGLIGPGCAIHIQATCPGLPTSSVNNSK
jgi:hypothetical protein